MEICGEHGDDIAYSGNDCPACDEVAELKRGHETEIDELKASYEDTIDDLKAQKDELMEQTK